MTPIQVPKDTISICINPYRGNQDPGIDWGEYVSTGSLLKKKIEEFRLAPFLNEVRGDEEDGTAQPEAVHSRPAALGYRQKPTVRKAPLDFALRQAQDKLGTSSPWLPR